MILTSVQCREAEIFSIHTECKINLTQIQKVSERRKVSNSRINFGWKVINRSSEQQQGKSLQTHRTIMNFFHLFLPEAKHFLCPTKTTVS